MQFPADVQEARRALLTEQNRVFIAQAKLLSAEMRALHAQMNLDLWLILEIGNATDQAEKSGAGNAS